ncbi:MAG: hypothetical protein ACLGHG_05860 [Gammaproteobacteria bacterium]
MSETQIADTSIGIRTAWRSGFKVYGFASAASLDDLREQLRETGHRYVHLVSTDPWDDRWYYVRSNIPVDDLCYEDVAWLRERDGPDRYLVCKL